MLRVLNAEFVAPEDYEIDPRFKEKKTETNSSTISIAQRVQQAQRNDTENIPQFMVLSVLHGIALGSEPSEAQLWEARWTFGTYVVCRILYTFMYVLSVQPHRTILFGMGIMAQFYLAGRLLQHALQSYLGDTGNLLPFLLMTPMVLEMLVYVVEAPQTLWMTVFPVTAKQKDE